jgi:hypothetical protein
MNGQRALQAGDVVEIELRGESISAIVLLVTEDAAIVDPCDGRVPFVLDAADLYDARIFDPALLAAA